MGIKMDKIAFAKLISYISNVSGYTFDKGSLIEIKAIIETKDQEQCFIKTYPCKNDVFDLMSGMFLNRKINAIKAYRVLTGEGLKESKDAVEAIMHRMSALKDVNIIKDYIKD